jgi:NADH:ubiquinone oxidoreductase 27 kD subunit
MTIEDQQTTVIDLSSLIGKVESFKNQGCRLVQMHCTRIEDNFEINYSFEKDLSFRTVRILVPMDTEVPSVSGIFWGAFIYENEMHDLFGVKVRGMNVDFKGNLIRTSVRYPFREPVFKGEGEGPCHERS